MMNLYPSTVPLTAEHLTRQEQRRDQSVRAVLAALLAAPGRAWGLEVRAGPPGSVTVAPGVAVWPPAAGEAPAVIEVSSLLTLPLPPGPGAWEVALSGAALLHTDPVPTPGGHSAFTVAARRAVPAQAPGGGAERVVAPGIFVRSAALPSELVLARVTVADQGQMTIAPTDTTLRLRGVPARPTPAPTLAAVVEAVLAALPAPPAVHVADVVEAVLAALPAPPVLDMPAVVEAVRAALPDPPVPELPRAYTLNRRWPLPASAVDLPHLTVDLPVPPPANRAVTFAGQGTLLLAGEASASVRPEVELEPEPTQLWAVRDPELRLGDLLALAGPNGGYYVSTVVPLRGEDGAPARGDGGGVVWRYALQRYGPSLSVPVAVVDSALSEVPEGADAQPWPLTLLSGALIWGSRPQAFTVADGGEADPAITRPSAYVHGRRLIGADRDGITAGRVWLTVRGTLLVTPLAAAPVGLTPDGEEG